jgi:hypothetical protein
MQPLSTVGHRCTRSVSAPPAVYYSHLAAFRAQHFMKEDQSETASSLSSSELAQIDWGSKYHDVHPALEDVMYFI